jgi:hypothetical protein
MTDDVNEPSEPEPAPTPVEPRRGRGPLIIGIVIGAIILLGVVGFFGSGAIQSRTFTGLVEATRAAEGAPVWKEFFIAQDCFIDAVVNASDAELAYNEGLTLLDETDLLAGHVEVSLVSFADVAVLPVHRALASAREAIVAHYEVWADHLANSLSILSTLDSEPSRLAVQFQAWVDGVLADSEAIETTFNDAEAAFESAALDDPSRQMVDTLFTPAEVECTRGAV